MRILTLLSWLIAGGCISLFAYSQEYEPTDADILPIPGKWRGNEQCMTLGSDNALPVSELTMTIRENELLSEYPATGRANSKFARWAPDSGLTMESPDFIRGLKSSSVVSEDGKRQLERLASALESVAAEAITYTFVPSDSVVSGKMFCLAGEKWCHFEATLRVKFGNNAFEVKGGDMLKDYGDRMIMVGYAYDEFSCAPDTCVVVCEANLIKE